MRVSIIKEINHGGLSAQVWQTDTGVVFATSNLPDWALHDIKKDISYEVKELEVCGLKINLITKP